MRFNRIYTDEELYDGIWIAFHGDTELVEKYHVIDGGSFEECVYDTYCNIKDATSETPCEWYHILMDDNVIGYFVVSTTYSFLYSFGININYRVENVLNIWFGYVSYMLNSQFTCALWAKNKRAIRYLEKNGMKIYEEKEDSIIFKLN